VIFVVTLIALLIVGYFAAKTSLCRECGTHRNFGHKMDCSHRK
jgi:hypothetical protein